MIAVQPRRALMSRSGSRVPIHATPKVLVAIKTCLMGGSVDAAWLLPAQRSLSSTRQTSQPANPTHRSRAGAVEVTSRAACARAPECQPPTDQQARSAATSGGGHDARVAGTCRSGRQGRPRGGGSGAAGGGGAGERRATTAAAREFENQGPGRGARGGFRSSDRSIYIYIYIYIYLHISTYNICIIYYTIPATQADAGAAGTSPGQHYVCVCVHTFFHIVLHVFGISGISPLQHMLAYLSLFVSSLLVLAGLRRKPLLP